MRDVGNNIFVISHTHTDIMQIIHGDNDQIVPIDAAGRASARIVENTKLIVYPGAPHGITDTHKDKLNAVLPAFLKD